MGVAAIEGRGGPAMWKLIGPFKFDTDGNRYPVKIVYMQLPKYVFDAKVLSIKIGGKTIESHENTALLHAAAT